MTIRIYEEDYRDHIFYILLQFEGIKNASFRVEIFNPHSEKTEEELEWYFEQYISQPYTAETKVRRIEKEFIAEYGITLFNQLFQDEESKSCFYEGVNDVGLDKLVIEIIAQKQSLEFQSILWESLRDPERPHKPLIARGVQFVRKSKKSKLIQARVNEHPEINLLVVTARPSEENDVNHRTIQRPIIETVRRTPKANVNVHILRPGTFMALKTHLDQTGNGFYHIIHFDLHGQVASFEDLQDMKKENKVIFSSANNATFGPPPETFQVRWGRFALKEFKGKRAFLFFESQEKGIADPVDSQEIGDLMQEKQIPVCILNACQSAKQSGIDNETNLGKFMMEGGVSMVLAMRYSVSVSAAEILMERIYSEIFEEQPLDRAISLGRMRLFDNKQRQAALGFQVDLEDWMLPIIYKKKDVKFSIRPYSEEERQRRNQKKRKELPFPTAKYGFYGRDLDILKIEKLLLYKNHLLLRGMMEVGKTTLLKYLSAWWTITNFRNIEHVAYLNFEEKTYTFGIFLDEIGKAIMDETQFKNLKKKDIKDREIEITEYLNRFPSALVLDNIFMLNDQKMIRFLSKIEGKSFVVYGSVNEEIHLASHTFDENIYILPPLDKSAAYQLARKIIESNTGHAFEHLMTDHKFDLEHLLSLLAGFPSAMELVLPFLKEKSVQEVLDEFQYGTLPIEFE